jgi:type I restriction enzyme R subunit
MGVMSESSVQAATRAWLESLGWQIQYGPEIAPEGHFAEGQKHGLGVVKEGLREALRVPGLRTP